MRAIRIATWPLGAAALACLLSSAAVQAAVSEKDHAFIVSAAEDGAAEVAMGKEAMKSDSAVIRQFGQQMVKEHGQLNSELTRIAKEKGVTPPSSPSVASQAKGAVTSVLPGSTFNNQYVESQLSDHRQTLQLLQDEAKTGHDPQLRKFAQEAIPIVQKHINELQVLQKKEGS